MLIVFLVGVFLATLSLCVGLYVWLNRDRLSAVEAVRARLFGADTPAENGRTLLKDTSTSDLEIVNKLLTGREVTARVRAALQAAAVDARPGTFLIGVAAAAAVGAVTGSFASSFGTVVGLMAGVVAPFVWLSSRRRRRRMAFEEQLPDALDMLTSAMRAGYSFPAAMKFIGEEIPAPLGPEFLRLYEEQRLGMDGRAALLALQSRVDSTDLKMFVTAVLIQRETGGNLAEVLGNIAEVMRQRADVQRQIETLTAESKMSARVLAALPVITFIAVAVIDPGFVSPMLTRGAGRLMLLYGACSVLAGYWILMRIARIDV